MLRKQRAEHQSLLGTTAQERGKLAFEARGARTANTGEGPCRRAGRLSSAGRRGAKSGGSAPSPRAQSRRRSRTRWRSSRLPAVPGAVRGREGRGAPRERPGPPPPPPVPGPAVTTPRGVRQWVWGLICIFAYWRGLKGPGGSGGSGLPIGFGGRGRRCGFLPERLSSTSWVFFFFPSQSCVLELSYSILFCLLLTLTIPPPSSHWNFFAAAQRMERGRGMGKTALLAVLCLCLRGAAGSDPGECRRGARRGRAVPGGAGACAGRGGERQGRAGLPLLLGCSGAWVVSGALGGAAPSPAGSWSGVGEGAGGTRIPLGMSCSGFAVRAFGICLFFVFFFPRVWGGF